MILLGMTGPIGHGKSTLASALKELEPSSKHLESSLIIAEVANAMHAALQTAPDPYDIESLNNWIRVLPAILLQTVNVKTTFGQLKLVQEEIEQHPIEFQKLILHVENLKRQPALMKQEITRENKESYRPMLQWLGGYLVQKVGKGIWYDEIIRRVYKAQSSGCNLCIVGGLRYPSDAAILRRAGAKIIKVYRPGHLQNDMLDPTERERDNIPVDSKIASDGTVEDVKNCAMVVLADLRSGTLQPTYHTSAFSSK